MKVVFNMRHPMTTLQRKELEALIGAFAEVHRQPHFSFDDGHPVVEQMIDFIEAAWESLGQHEVPVAIIPPGLGTAAFVMGRWMQSRNPDIKTIWFRQEVGNGGWIVWHIGGIA